MLAIRTQQITVIISHNHKLARREKPRPDGFNPKLYKTFMDELAPFLTKVYNSINTCNGFLKQSLEAIITVIFKEGKDIANDCPISLIHLDIKMVAKLLANRIQLLIPLVIDNDQVGFVKGRGTITLIEKIQRRGLQDCLLTCDTKKVIDQVQPRSRRSMNFQQQGLG